MTGSTVEEEEQGLTDAQIAQFNRDGYLGPLRLCDPDEAADHWERIQHDVFDRGRPDDAQLSEKGYPIRADRHRDSRATFDLVTDDRVIEKLADLYGRDLLLWFSNVWDKSPGDSAVAWHQEINELPIYPPVCGLAWIALSDVTAENGCLEFVPGTHRRAIPHRSDVDTEEYSMEEMADPGAFDEDRSVRVELDPGEFVLFSSRVLHRSRANQSDDDRIGVNLAVMPPQVSVDRSAADWFFPELAPTVVHGRNGSPLHETIDPP